MGNRHASDILFEIVSPGLITPLTDDARITSYTAFEMYLYLNSQTHLLQIHTGKEDRFGILVMKCIGSDVEHARRLLINFIGTLKTVKLEHEYRLEESIILKSTKNIKKTEKDYPVGYVHVLAREDDSVELSAQSDAHPTICEPYISDTSQLVQARGQSFAEVCAALEQFTTILSHAVLQYK